MRLGIIAALAIWVLPAAATASVVTCQLNSLSVGPQPMPPADLTARFSFERANQAQVTVTGVVDGSAVDETLTGTVDRSDDGRRNITASIARVFGIVALLRADGSASATLRTRDSAGPVYVVGTCGPAVPLS